MPLKGVYVQYYREPSPPPSAWREDLARIADAGFSGIQLRPQWRWHERRDGEFNWDELHQLCDLAQANRLRVVIQFIAEMAPGWFLKKLRPYRCDLTGAPQPPGAISAMYIGGWEPCYDHPAVPEHAARFIAEGVAALKHHACIEAWHVWNEPRSRPMWDCGCEHSIRAYQQWLRDRYTTIENLNAITGKAWGDFDEIISPTRFNDYTELFLFRTWAVERVAPRVAWATRAARAADPSRPVWSHVGYAVPGQNPVKDGSPDWLLAQQVDRYGLSMPLRGGQIGEVDTERWPMGASLLCDWMRSLSPGGAYHAWEIYPDLGCGIQGIPARQFGQWLWQAAAAGAERICIWQYRSERIGTESGDAGLVEVDGSTKPHLHEASSFIKTWTASDRHEVLDALRPATPTVWIAHDFASQLLWNVEQQGDGEYLFGPGPEIQPRPQSPKRHTLFRWYHIFRQAGFEVGFFSCDQLKSGAVELPQSDSLIVLPSLYMLNESLCRQFADWTRAGGRLLVCAGTASREASTFVRENAPGPALRDLLGLREMTYRWFTPDAARLAMAIGGETTAATAWPLARADIDPARGHDILATWSTGSPALVATAAGRGRAAWLSAALDVDDGPTTILAERLLPRLVQSLGLDPQIPVGGPGDAAGWLSRRYETRLSIHPTLGQFLWVFAPAGATIEFHSPDWSNPFDWLSGQLLKTPLQTSDRTTLCLSPTAPCGLSLKAMQAKSSSFPTRPWQCSVRNDQAPMTNK